MHSYALAPLLVAVGLLAGATSGLAQTIEAPSAMQSEMPAHVRGELHPIHWDYLQDAGGPSHWAELDPGFEACGKGMNQTPIDLHNALPSNLPALEFGYGEAAVTLLNNGHTVQVNVPPGQTLTIDRIPYALVQFHFHTPSEESIDGQRAAMVAHFVHRSTAGGLVVVAVLMQPGKGRGAFEPVFANLPTADEKLTMNHLKLDLSAMLPSDLKYFAFNGSLNTPPCSEAVSWIVLKKPVYLEAAQIQAFRQLIGENARPLQSPNGRVVRVSK